MKNFLQKVRLFWKKEVSNSDTKLENLPESFSIYDRYTNTRKIKVIIRLVFKIPALVKDFNVNDSPFFIKQDGSVIHISYHKELPEVLVQEMEDCFDEFKKKRNKRLTKPNPSQLIIPYFEEVLFKLNKEIARRKYQEGHLILRNLSEFDIDSAFIINPHKNGKVSAISWPLPLPGFKETPPEANVTFVRDLIDAMSEYLYFDLDECIRKVITSTENFFIYYDLKAAPPTEKSESKFKRKVKLNISSAAYPFKDRDLQILRHNILFIYKIRNLIVHNNLRLEPEDKVFCKKAIGTLLYILHASVYTNKDRKAEPIFMLDGHFKMVTDIIFGSRIEVHEQAKNSGKQPGIIKNGDDMNKWIFGSLKIKECEKECILKRANV